MTVYDQAYELQENLTAFLTQQYAPGYEVVVVDESSTDETPDILKLQPLYHLPTQVRRACHEQKAGL